ncbi:serine hydrolase domain-containing protein [Colwellia psychrerythraea]|uniref:Putative beta-lactamase n=1 Tax=Colwellia psychrerythraea (strain 34H / ATCC BAA-681) TaxID=167879 RepID=Q483F4_COLP3|nr:serine hydrolase domain-containing protein [Colwellia psychrerythraea]AAZ28499.1 putative beta-lactamase [Colwellia psychrerythraea 34H]
MSVITVYISLSAPLHATEFVTELKHGYSAEKAYALHNEWSLPKFLVPTETGAYSYLHLGEFLPQAIIYREGKVSLLEQKTDKKVGQITLPNKEGKSLTLESMINDKASPVQGVMVLHKGKVVFEQYSGMRKNDNHVWMSNAKPVASLLIAQLEEEGKIDVSKPLSTYMKKTVGTAWENIKIIDILNMQTGLDLAESYKNRKNPNSSIMQFFAAELGAPNSKGIKQTHNQALFSIKALKEPGQAFEYSSANTQMLGLLIEAVTGRKIVDLISERIWSLAGMTGDATIALSPQGNAIIHGLISSRLVDMARFGLLYTPSWSKTASEQVVSKSAIIKIQQGGKAENYIKDPSVANMLTKRFGEKPLFNSYQWDAVFSDGDFYKGGMNGQGIYVSPEKDVVVAWFATGFAEISMESFARKIALSY